MFESTTRINAVLQNADRASVFNRTLQTGGVRIKSLLEYLVLEDCDGDPQMKIAFSFFLLLAITPGVPGALAQAPADRQQLIRVEAPLVVLTHVRVIDGTGAPARE